MARTGCASPLMKILAINVGSSSIKCWFGEAASADQVVERKRVQTDIASAEDVARALPKVLEPLWLLAKGPEALDAIAHRIVHAGPKHRQTAWLTAEVREAIAANAEFAPSHNRLELAALAAMDGLLPDPSRQVAVFDTGFHATLAREAYVYPGPYEWQAQGIRRYGFHGINYAHVSRRAAEMLGRPLTQLRLIACHLGNGSSLAAIAGGKSIDTTMGFTPADGLMMGSRCGSLDPGIIVYLLRHGGYTADALDQIFNRESGLRGISGVSSDMRKVLEAMAAGDARAELAFDIYAHRLCRETGAMLAVLGGLDALVFTGGIGEHCAPLRERLCTQLGFLGLKLDAAKNAQARADVDIASADSQVRVLVIAADEELEMARECARLAVLKSPV
jgi:acetate kinase